MPRSQKAEALALARTDQFQNRKITRIDQYYASSHCIVCRQITEHGKSNTCKFYKPTDTNPI